MVAGTAVVVAWLVVTGAVVVVGAVSADPPPQADATNRTVTNTPTRFMVPSLSPHPEGGGGDVGAPGVDTRRQSERAEPALKGGLSATGL